MDETFGLSFLKPAKANRILVPDEILDRSDLYGPVYGYINEDTGVHIIVSMDSQCHTKNVSKIGEIVNTGDLHGDKIIGVRTNENIEFYLNNQKLTIERYSLVQNVFSRNKGLLESTMMQNKCVIFVGVGSVCSLIALQLARSGLGKFVLVDTDVVDIHNICRHQCGFSDVGRFKVDAVADRIWDINPNAQITKFTRAIEDISEEELNPFFGENSVIVSGADNRHADSWASHIAYHSNTPFVSTGFWNRAFASETFYWLPNKDMACYNCVLGRMESNKPEKQLYYTNQEEAEKLNFEPGLSVDIEFGTTIGTKVILDILNRNESNYTIRVLNDYGQYILTCNTNNKKIGGEKAEMFERPLITLSLNVEKQDDCPDCGKNSLNNKV